ncbi:MAG: orotate phosphoribosyltransferase [Bifidobacteriaceae bacterium]|jgi:orotate phosphoribosyltransferase|nr:orotate phosphoribosyltransferase [Bifidobacteriaceae bacterium]
MNKPNINTDNLKTDIAYNLLKIKAITLSPNKPFTWASGIKSPIYTDNRITLSYPKIRRSISKGLAYIIKQNYPGVEVIAGTATAGIPHGTLVANELNLPFIYIRSKPKDHGQGNQIEGLLQPRQKVVLIEDLISTGLSVITASQAVEKVGAEVLGIAGIFTYNLTKASNNFKNNNYKLITLTDFETLLKTAKTKNYIENKDMKLLKDFVKSL